MHSETNKREENVETKPAICETGAASDRNEKTGSVFTRRKFCQTGAIAGGLAAATISNLTPGTAPAADVTPDFTALDATRKAGPDFSKIPQRLHEYPASDRAKEIVRRSITMDSLFSGVWPMQWSRPEAPEFHDEMDRCKEAGFKVLAACPSTDSADASMLGIVKAVEFYLKKLNERPAKYKIVRNVKDIDDAIKEDKLGIFFTHQGTALFGGDLDRVGLFRQLGYGYCLLAYNTRNPVGDGCFEPDNGRLTGYGKLLIDAYNQYGMIVDVSHTANRTALDAIERSRQPVISSHSVAKSVVDYQRSISDDVIKGIAASGGVCCINMVGAFVDLSNPDIVTTDMLFRHIDYMVNLVGIDHVGFGSDYIPDMTQTAIACQSPLGDLFFPDGGYTREMAAKGCPTPAPYQIVAALVDKLLEKDYSSTDCSKFLGGNLYRVFKQVWG
jgi:membrane dipeptidase